MKKLISTIGVLGALALVLGGGAHAETTFDPAEATANGHYHVSGNWSELKRGWNTLVLNIMDMDEKPVVGAAVTVAYDMVGMPMNPPDRAVVEKGDGLYEKEIFLGMRGDWKFNVTVDLNSMVDSLERTQKVNK